MAKLFSRHDPAAQARYQEVKRLAYLQRRLLAGTPGTLKQRKRGATVYWVREHIRADGRKDDEHLGTASGLSARKLDEARDEIDLAKRLAAGSSALRLFGYQRVDRKVAAVLTALYNRRLLQGGLVLIGSHAYGALLNECGILAAGYRTQDIDVARAQPLAVALPEGLDFGAVLQESDLEFVPVPGLPSHKPSGSYKLPGKESIAVDLLAPGRETGAPVAVSELRAHAAAVPLLEFLLEDPIDGALLSPNQVVPLKLPSPERFVVHKLFSSQSRKSARDKIRKDLRQAAALAVAVEEDTPGRIAEAFRDLPAAGRPAVRRGARAVTTLLKSLGAETGAFASIAS